MGKSRKRIKKEKRRRTLLVFAMLTLFICMAILVCVLIKNMSSSGSSQQIKIAESEDETAGAETIVFDETIASAEEETSANDFEKIHEEADRLAMSYDYDGAIELLKSEDIPDSYASEAASMITKLEAEKDTLVRQEPTEITHIFVHSLIIDTARAFDGDKKSKGYNQVMTTESEFRKILEQMYERGYVLVGLHDICEETRDAETGKHQMVYRDIYLPPGKKAFVLSQDDVCYYEYQHYDGFASRMVIGDDGRPICEYQDASGNVSAGEYDLVPILDHFIDDHPDFSYKGAKAIIAFTGYNGVLGYRTDETYDPSSSLYDSKLADAPNENLDEDRKKAVEVLNALVADGYELASHSWGHLDMSNCNYSRFTRDADRWDKNVNSLIKEATGKSCDIMIYPYGTDIGSWKGYAQKNINCDGKHPDGYDRFCYYHNLGFRYYCNVDSAKYFVQKGNDYMRMARRNVDGYRMWQDLSNPGSAKLDDLIDVATVFDSARPTPVPDM